ncbi:MAG: energy transducer TonB [Deltaproteobacteria bacterium]|nr:MAG: energy transducer TonB [Deltaproteobacteria bacterium]
MTAIRLPVSFVLSLLATAALFWLLGVLITVDPAGTVIPVVPGIDFTPKIPDTETITKPPIDRPPKEKPKPPPDVPTVTIDPKVIPGDDQNDLAPARIGYGPGEIAPPTRHGDIGPSGSPSSDHGPIPRVRIAPDYPRQAADRGIEGWVTFRFTVAVDGSVQDVAILDSDPPHIWDSATKRAVSSWKYQPAIRDGRPVEQRGVTVTYRYELER